jgi:hypothetical protein
MTVFYALTIDYSLIGVMRLSTTGTDSHLLSENMNVRTAPSVRFSSSVEVRTEKKTPTAAFR